MIHLTGQNCTSRETIQNIFSPLVGVITSLHADELCHRNHVTFVELLQPFARLQNEAQIRDVMGTSVSIRGLRLNFCDVDWRPPQTVLARKMLNESVTNAYNDKTRILRIDGVTLEIPLTEQWFDDWRETFLTVQFPADHEFTRHLLSCLIVVSSNDPNIIDTAHKLMQRVHQMQNVTPQKLPKWFQSNDVLNSCVVLHDGSQGDISQAQQSYELLKSTFGDTKCFLLQINSIANNTGNNNNDIPDYWSAYIKRHRKQCENSNNNLGSADQLSNPKTPQDAVATLSMPNIRLSTITDNDANETSILHPLSPTQEQVTEILNTKFSTSTESIASININPNVWANELDTEAAYGQCLSAGDIENLKHFVHDYAMRALIPYVEYLMGILNETITNKKGVSKSLLSATKRWFVTSKPGASASNQNAVIYTQESVELQTRKLGDLYFMFCHYNMAFQAYHQAKRDFHIDSAWQYYAGALEMAALSAFMLGTANRKTYDYMEDAILCYLNVCKLQQFATRATLLSVECLKTARLHGEAAKQLIRMISEESDLRSALLLEQAAYCYLAATPVMYRKYAFNIVLAGNRYSRAGQRKHAYRCYSQAYQIFRQRGWSLAEDHIQLMIGKQASMLKKLDEASDSFAYLLRPGSQQTPAQQLSFLRDYLHIQNAYIKQHPELGLIGLAVPQVRQESIRILTLASLPPPTFFGSYCKPASNIDINSDLHDENIWLKMEEMLVTTATQNKLLVFKSLRSLFTHETPTIDNPIAVQGESIEVAVSVTNTIRCALQLNKLELLWKLKLDNDDELSNICLYETGVIENPNKSAVKAAIKSSPPQTLNLDELATQTLHFKLTVKLTGQLTLIGMVAELISTAESTATTTMTTQTPTQTPTPTMMTMTTMSLLGTLKFETAIIKPSGRPTPTPIHQYDQKLHIRVIPTLPCLSVGFSVVPDDLIAGEIIPVIITLRNEGSKPIEDIYLTCDNPRWFTIQGMEPYIPVTLQHNVKNSSSNEKIQKDKEIRRQRVFHLLQTKSANYLRLDAQESTSVLGWLQAPFDSGNFCLRLMIYYGMPADHTAHIRYRLVRHQWKFHVHECLQTNITCVISNQVTGELSLSIDVRNNNRMHHPIMAELYINSLALYNTKLQLNAKKFYLINPMEISNGFLGENSLKPSKSASFQCGLLRSQPLITDSSTDEKEVVDIFANNLSYMDIMSVKAAACNSQNEQLIPKIHTMYGFLAKHETTYFNTSLTSEEFNNIIATKDTHATVVLCWTAVVVQNSQQRIAQGQHFVQIRNMYESRSCPPNASQSIRPMFVGKTSLNRNTDISIDHLADMSVQQINELCKELCDNPEPPEDIFIDIDDNFWKIRGTNIGERCYLEDDPSALSAKA